MAVPFEHGEDGVDGAVVVVDHLVDDAQGVELTTHPVGLAGDERGVLASQLFVVPGPVRDQPTGVDVDPGDRCGRSEEHTSELQSLMRNSYALFCLKKKK